MDQVADALFVMFKDINQAEQFVAQLQVTGRKSVHFVQASSGANAQSIDTQGELSSSIRESGNVYVVYSEA
jgi:hypothetical protein